MRKVKSRDNPAYKRLMACKAGQRPGKAGLVKLEGIRQLADLDPALFPLDTLYFSDDEKGDKAQKALLGPGGSLEGRVAPDRLVILAPALFRQASDQKTDQGVLALVRIQWGDPLDFLDRKGREKDLKLLVLVGVQDPGNAGTLIRTADALGLDGVFLLEGTVSLYNPKLLAASMGSLFHLPVFEPEGPARAFLTAFKDRNIDIIATGLDGKDLETGWSPEPSFALVLGNEGKGLDLSVMEAADQVVRLPMTGRAQSLNVAAAGAILIWEAVRDRA